MAVFNSMNGVLTVDNSPWNKGLDAAGKKLGEFGKNSKGVLNDLKSMFGRGSALGGWAKVFAGGGALVGANFAAKEIEAASAKMVELKNEFNSGAISAGELGLKMAEELPIAGHLVKTLENVGELITGSNAAIAKQVELYKQIADERERIAKIEKDIHDFQQGQQKTIQETADKLAIAAQPDDHAKSFKQAELEAQRAHEELQKQFDAQDISGKLAKEQGSLPGLDKAVKDAQIAALFAGGQDDATLGTLNTALKNRAAVMDEIKQLQADDLKNKQDYAVRSSQIDQQRINAESDADSKQLEDTTKFFDETSQYFDDLANKEDEANRQISEGAENALKEIDDGNQKLAEKQTAAYHPVDAISRSGYAGRNTGLPEIARPLGAVEKIGNQSLEVAKTARDYLKTIADKVNGGGFILS